MPLKVIERHGSKFLYLRGSVRGVAIDESTKVTDRGQAEEIRAKREAEIIERQITGKKAHATFLEAAVSYMENGGERRFLERLISHFGSKSISHIGQSEVEAAARKLYPGASASTINRQVFTPVSAIMSHAAKRKLGDKPTFDRPAQPRGRIRWITYKEADKLIAGCAKHLAPLVTFLLYTGCRAGEAMSLQWREIDLERAHATFLDTKNGDRRGIPLHPRAISALEALKHREGHVFLSRGARPFALTGAGGGQIKNGFAAACKRAGITDFRPHDCRHTWATWHYAANRDIAALMRLGGWRSTAMVLRYAHVNVEDLTDSVSRIGENPGRRRQQSNEVLEK